MMSDPDAIELLAEQGVRPYDPQARQILDVLGYRPGGAESYPFCDHFGIDDELAPVLNSAHQQVTRVLALLTCMVDGYECTKDGDLKSSLKMTTATRCGSPTARG